MISISLYPEINSYEDHNVGTCTRLAISFWRQEILILKQFSGVMIIMKTSGQLIREWNPILKDKLTILSGLFQLLMLKTMYCILP